MLEEELPEKEKERKQHVRLPESNLKKEQKRGEKKHQTLMLQSKVRLVETDGEIAEAHESFKIKLPQKTNNNNKTSATLITISQQGILLQ